MDTKESALVLTEHIYVFARIALSDPLVFNQLVAGVAPALKMPETQVFEGILDQWWSKVANPTARLFLVYLTICSPV